MNSTDNFDKCLYELLNYNDIDENTFDKLEEIEIADFKDQKIKKIIYKKVNYKKRTGIYAASILLFLSFFTISFSNVAFASSIKHSINTIIKELKGDFADYDTYSTYINSTKKDNNVIFTIDRLSSDGKHIYISFNINSEKDIKSIIENPANLSIDLKVDGEAPLAYGYSQNGKMVDKNNYSGILSVDISTESLANTFYLDMTINSIDQIKGLWDFKLKVDKRDIVSKTKKYNINKNISIQNSNFKIKTIESNPVSTIVKIDGYLHNFFLLDDKGRLIKEKSGDSNNKGTTLTFKSLIDKGTKSLTFIPYKFGEDYNNFKPEIYEIHPTPFEIPQGNFGTITIKELIWNKDELRINYTATGKLPVIQSEGMYLLDDSGNMIIEENRFNTQISQDNQKDFYMIFKGVSKDKKYKIASNRLDKFYNIDEASKFTIDLK